MLSKDRLIEITPYYSEIKYCSNYKMFHIIFSRGSVFKCKKCQQIRLTKCDLAGLNITMKNIVKNIEF